MESGVSRSGGLYVPPHKVARLAAEISEDRYGEKGQRLAWEKLRKNINGCVNKVNSDNLNEVAVDVFRSNLIRGRGLFVKAIMRSQAASTLYTGVFAALVAVVNSRIPDIGLLLIRRVSNQLKRALKRRDRALAITILTFIAHLINQRVLSDISALEISDYLLSSTSEDQFGMDERVLWCCEFLKHVGEYLEEELSKGMIYITNQLHSILNEGTISEHTQYKVEEFFDIRRQRYSGFPRIPPGLDVLDASDCVTHTVDVFAEHDREDMLDVFKFVDPEEYKIEEEKWTELSHNIVGDATDGDSASEDEGAVEELLNSEKAETIDNTEGEKLRIRKNIYLCIMSSLNYEESVHKLLKLDCPVNEVSTMLIDCCVIDRTFNRSLAMQAERLCLINKAYVEELSNMFISNYAILHRYETNNLRNLAKFYSHLFSTRALPIDIISCIRLTENDTTAASRIFIKILVQELVNNMGLEQVQKTIRENDELFANTLLLRTSKPQATFCYNFFTAIGLSSLAEDLRAYIQSSSTAVATT